MPLRTGEVVDVAIKGVRVDHEDADGIVTVLAENPLGATTRYEMPPQSAIKRVAPAEWPPQPGDVWADSDGDAWFAVTLRDSTEIRVTCADRNKPRGIGNWIASSRVADLYGPMRLLYRREDQEDGDE